MSVKKLQKIIENCSADEFRQFFSHQNPDFIPDKIELSQYHNEKFPQCEKLGEIPFTAEEKLLICFVQVNNELTERTGKKKQYDLGKRILKENQFDAGVFIFYDENSNFRFSFIYTEYSGRNRMFSYFKRYTFFVSPQLTNKTFLTQIGNCDFATIDKIKEAFSVKPVTEEFYSNIQTWYFWALDQIQFPDDYKYSDNAEKDKKNRNAINLIRLITRIIFIWFLKQKNLVPGILFDKNQLKDIVKNFGDGNNYYNAILQNLFFGTLNQKMTQRQWAEDKGFQSNKKTYGIKTLYRYEKKFKISKDEVIALFKGIPFLNGGLFDCLDKEDDRGKVIYIDGFSRNPKKQAKIPDNLFFQEQETIIDLSKYDLGKHNPVRGLIEILKSYNFTVDENTPIDQEVALDPELLGKVFENLLAAYNPETSTTARQSTGSYYTPREIVDYMVEESLIQYLKSHLTGMNEEEIRLISSYSEKLPEMTKEQKQKIINAIDSIKILDPACGSGAFPMGILHKLVHILQKLDDNNERWRELQFQKVVAESKKIFKEKNKKEREEHLKEINDSFDDTMNYPDYARKLFLIENCIYGVDIQPIAVQISKLRFFISLVLDQKVDNNKENFGIRPLPNLETKFVATNTLIEIKKPEHLFYTNEIEKIEDELKRLRHKYFQTKTRGEKISYQNQDKELRWRLGEKLNRIGYSSEDSKKIAEFDLFDQNASANWFDSEWMFGIKDGFDIVIGNPPYIKEYINRDTFNGLRKSHYYKGKMDIWYLFACQGIDLLKEKKGVLTFIAQNNWVTSFGASIMRNKVIKETKIINLCDFGSYMIFENSDIQTMIMIFQYDNISDNYKFDHRKLKGNNLKFQDALDLLYYNKTDKTQFLFPIIQRKKIINQILTFSDSNIEKVLIKLTSKSNFYFHKNELAQGIVYPQDLVNKKSQKKLSNKHKIGDGIFVLSEKEKNRIPFTKEELKLIKPSYTTKELFRYYGNRDNSEWVLYLNSKFKNPENIKPYPNIKKHLDKFLKVTTSDNKPYGLHRARKEYFFKGVKIIAVRKCLKPTFTYTDFDCYVSATFYVIKTNRINLKYLTALFNSKLIEFWLKHKGKMQGEHFQIDKEPLLKIPIYKPNKSDIEFVIELVDKILFIMQADDYFQNYEKQAQVKKYEKQIDDFMYTLYDLTDEEIKIIEGGK